MRRNCKGARNLALKAGILLFTAGSLVITACDEVSLSESGALLWTVTFDTQGGSAIEAQKVADRDYASRPEEDPSKPNPAEGDTAVVFDDWYKEASGGDKFDFGLRITENVTVYAQWITRAAALKREIEALIPAAEGVLKGIPTAESAENLPAGTVFVTLAAKKSLDDAIAAAQAAAAGSEEEAALQNALDALKAAITAAGNAKALGTNYALVDRSALNAAITSAALSLEAALEAVEAESAEEVPVGTMWVKTGARQALIAALEAARALAEAPATAPAAVPASAEAPDPTQPNVDAAVKALLAALAAFKPAEGAFEVIETREDAEAALALAQESLASVVIAASAEDADEGEAWVTEAQYDALEAVVENIAYAISVLDDEEADEEEKAAAEEIMKSAVSTLNAALAVFEAEIEENGPGTRESAPPDDGVEPTATTGTGGVTIALLDTGALAISGWDGGAISLHESAQKSFIAAGFDNPRWYVDGTLAASGSTLTVHGAAYDQRTHSVTFIGEKHSVPYSQVFSFTIVKD